MLLNESCTSPDLDPFLPLTANQPPAPESRAHLFLIHSAAICTAPGCHMGSAPVPGLFGFTLAHRSHPEDLSLSIRRYGSL